MSFGEHLNPCPAESQDLFFLESTVDPDQGSTLFFSLIEIQAYNWNAAG